MRLFKNKGIRKVIFASSILIYIVITIYLSNNKYGFIHENSGGSVENNTTESMYHEGKPSTGYSNDVNAVGNANYFNARDGTYYADAEYTIKANDNTAYLLQMFDSGNPVILPQGNFLCGTKIILKGKEIRVQGVQGKTKIVFDSKDFKNYGNGSFAECLIINGSYNDKYVQKTAQSINISNVVFEYKRYSLESPKTIMLFKNVNGVVIDNCSYIADLPNKISVTNLDFYNACKNVRVQNTSFINKTKASSGGCIWVRNLTSQEKSVFSNTTENVTIDQCIFDKDSNDEVVAIFSSVGNVKNVVIKNCQINDYSENLDIVLSIYSSESKYYGAVNNVIIENNKIYSKNFKAFVIVIGNESTSKSVSNVKISSNQISAESSNNNRKAIIYNVGTNAKSNVLVENNTIYAKELSRCTAVQNVRYVKGNSIIGELENGIIGGETVNNVIDGAINGIGSPDRAEKNIISNVKVGIIVLEGRSHLINNKITLANDAGVCGIQTSSQDKVTCSNNKVYTSSNTQYGFIVKSKNIILSKNEVFGQGINILKNE